MCAHFWCDCIGGVGKDRIELLHSAVVRSSEPREFWTFLVLKFSIVMGGEALCFLSISFVDLNQRFHFYQRCPLTEITGILCSLAFITHLYLNIYVDTHNKKCHKPTFISLQIRWKILLAYKKKTGACASWVPLNVLVNAQNFHWMVWSRAEIKLTPPLSECWCWIFSEYSLNVKSFAKHSPKSWPQYSQEFQRFLIPFSLALVLVWRLKQLCLLYCPKPYLSPLL